MLGLVLITIIVLFAIILEILKVLNENKKNRKKLSYIEDDDIEKESKEIDDFIRKKQCYIPKE